VFLFLSQPSVRCLKEDAEGVFFFVFGPCSDVVYFLIRSCSQLTGGAAD